MWFSGIIQNNLCCIRRKWVIKSCTICHYKAVASHWDLHVQKTWRSVQIPRTHLIDIIVKVGETIFFRHMLRLTLFVSTRLYHATVTFNPPNPGWKSDSFLGGDVSEMHEESETSIYSLLQRRTDLFPTKNLQVPVENRKVSSCRDTP